MLANLRLVNRKLKDILLSPAVIKIPINKTRESYNKKHQ